MVKYYDSDIEQYSNLDGATDAEVIKASNECISAWGDYWGTPIKQGVEMRSFMYLPDGQWLKSHLAERNLLGKSAIQINLLLAIERKILAEERAANPEIDVIPENADVKSKKLKIISGLLADIEYQSDAPTIYSGVYTDERDLGYGAAENTIEKESPTSFNNVIRMCRVDDALATFWDTGAKHPNKIDSDGCGYFKTASINKLRREYPDKRIDKSESFPLPKYYDFYSVGVDEIVTLKYWHRNYFESEIVMLEDGAQMDIKTYEKCKEDSATINKALEKRYQEVVEQIISKAKEVEEIERKKSGNQDFKIPEEILEDAIAKVPEPDLVVVAPIKKDRKCKEMKQKYMDWWIESFIITKTQVLERKKWPLKDAPLFFAPGDIRKCSGKEIPLPAMRSSAPAQQLLNITISEIIDSMNRAFGPRVFAHCDVIAPFRQSYIRPTASNLLEFDNPDEVPESLVRPELVNAPVVDQSLLMVMEQAINLLQYTTGRYRDNSAADTNGMSGVALDKRQVADDLSTGVYTDNLNKLIAEMSRQRLELIPYVYDTERTILLRNKDGTTEYQVINQVNGDMDDQGIPMRENDLSEAKFGIEVQGGASFTSQRTQAANFLLQLSDGDDKLKSLSLDLLLQQTPFPYTNELIRRLRESGYIDPAVVAQEEGKSLPPPKPDPLQQIEEMKSQVEKAHLMKEVLELFMQHHQHQEANEIEKEKNKLAAAKLVADVAEHMIDAEAKEVEAMVEHEKVLGAALDGHIDSTTEMITNLLTMQEDTLNTVKKSLTNEE